MTIHLVCFFEEFIGSSERSLFLKWVYHSGTQKYSFRSLGCGISAALNPLLNPKIIIPGTALVDHRWLEQIQASEQTLNPLVASSNLARPTKHY